MALRPLPVLFEGETPIGLDWDKIRADFLEKASPEEREAQEESLIKHKQVFETRSQRQTAARKERAIRKTRMNA